jgi:glutamate---cysteine ligase / carboxylate-amine ligase
VGEEQRLGYEEMLARSREGFDSVPDFTVAVEEEFALIDPDTLGLVNRFEELQEAARGTELEPHLVGELIASEIEIRTGRCDSFADAAALLGERRQQLRALAEPRGVALAATGTHPWSPWQEQRIIDTPHYRLNDEVLRYVVWRNNSFGIHVHVGIHGADRAIAVHRALRTVLPELLALSSSSPWLEGRYTYLHSTRTEIFTKFFPRCGIPDGFADWDDYAEFVRFLVDTRSIREHTEIWWSVRPHQAYPTVETRICDGQPDFARSVALAGLQVALTADFARRYDAGEPLPDHPARDLEENFWRAIRWGMSGELIDLELRRAMPAAERIERLLDRVAGTADDLGIAPYLAPLRGPTLVQELIDRLEAGTEPRELWPAVVDRTERSAAQWLASGVEGER